MPNKIDLAGRIFGRLHVIEDVGVNKNGKFLWKCVCDCGNEKIALSQPLLDGRTQSCGCLHKEQLTERLTKHGLTKVGKRHPLYLTWAGMKQRCYNPKSLAYDRYGGRGIKVCDRWLNSFPNFLQDMGEKPSKHHSLERDDNDGDYSPKNCRWATLDIQSKNKRSNIWIEYGNEKYVISDWATKIGITQQHLRSLLLHKPISEIISKYKR